MGDDADQSAVLFDDGHPPHLVLRHQSERLVEILLRVDQLLLRSVRLWIVLGGRVFLLWVRNRSPFGLLVAIVVAGVLRYRLFHAGDPSRFVRT